MESSEKDETGEKRPLLGHSQEDVLWDAVESANTSESQATWPTELDMTSLLRGKPNEVIRTLQKYGVRKLGEFTVPDTLVLNLLGDDSIITMGSDSQDIDFVATWQAELRSRQGLPHDTPDASTSGWHNEITVQAYVVTIRGAARPDKDGLLQPLLRRWQMGACKYTVFAVPAAHAVIDFKWTRFARRLLLAEFGCFAVWMAAFYVWTAVFQDEDVSLSLTVLLSTLRGRVAVACDVLAVLGMTPFILIEGATIQAYGLRGWASIWNILDVGTYLSQVAITGLHLGRLGISSGWLSIAASLQCLLLLFKLQYFSRVFPATRFAFLDDIHQVLTDVRWYLVFIVLIVLGYAASFQILFRADQAQHEEFSNLPRAFVQMVTWAAGNADLAPLYSHAQNPAAACFLGVSFVFVLGMVLFNLLIGLMTNSLDRLTSDEDVRALSSKATVIDELEAAMPGWVERRFPYFFPDFLHVIRVDPQKMDVVDPDRKWSKMGESTSEDLGQLQATNGNKDSVAEQKDVAAKLEHVLREIQELKDMVLRYDRFRHDER